MFFPRLRRHAKWMFVFLAVALGGGFVLFGVGAGGTGVGDILRGGGGERRPVDLERAEEDRGEPEGRRSVARAVDGATDRRTDRRGDRRSEARSSCWLRRTPTLSASSRASISPSRALKQQRSAARADPDRLPGRRPGLPRPARRVRPASSLLDDRISAAVNAEGSASDPDPRRRRTDCVRSGASTRTRRSSCSSPSDPNIQLELAQAAQQAGDAETAIAAYTAFLKLAPDDPSASIVKAQLKQLKQTSASSG